MREMGVREVKARLSEVLRDVERGEVVRITSRGRTVAELSPPRSDEDPLDRLIREGRATPPSRPRGPLPEPVQAAQPASRFILQEREEDR